MKKSRMSALEYRNMIAGRNSKSAERMSKSEIDAAIEEMAKTKSVHEQIHHAKEEHYKSLSKETFDYMINKWIKENRYE
jgi:hypothetical protein